jgi:hypothetical protein
LNRRDPRRMLSPSSPLGMLPLEGGSQASLLVDSTAAPKNERLLMRNPKPIAPTYAQTVIATTMAINRFMFSGTKERIWIEY